MKNRWRKTRYYHQCQRRYANTLLSYIRDELVKFGVNEPGPGRQAQLQNVRCTTSKLCDGDSQWYLQKSGSDCDSSLWQDNVNAAVVIAWQIPPLCNRQAARPSCSMGPRDSRTCFSAKQCRKDQKVDEVTIREHFLRLMRFRSPMSLFLFLGVRISMLVRLSC